MVQKGLSIYPIVPETNSEQLMQQALRGPRMADPVGACTNHVEGFHASQPQDFQANEKELVFSQPAIPESNSQPIRNIQSQPQHSLSISPESEKCWLQFQPILRRGSLIPANNRTAREQPK
jgi:hypothetical protein